MWSSRHDTCVCTALRGCTAEVFDRPTYSEQGMFENYVRSEVVIHDGSRDIRITAQESTHNPCDELLIHSLFLQTRVRVAYEQKLHTKFSNRQYVFLNLCKLMVMPCGDALHEQSAGSLRVVRSSNGCTMLIRKVQRLSGSRLQGQFHSAGIPLNLAQ